MTMGHRGGVALVAAALVLGSSCGGDDGGGADGGGTDASGSGSADASASMTQGSADSSTTEDLPGPGECGNGVLDGDEQCDDGQSNSDSEPDACRTDCRVAHCADGVIDPSLGEECDDANGNSNEPNACRVDCTLPRCGDGVKDTGEPCDDGNEMWGDTCYECSNLWYFVLNSPDQTGGGSPSILRSTREGTPVEVVGGDASLDGIVQIELGPMGATLYALQSAGNVDRVVALDPLDGTTVGEVAIDAALLGSDPELQGLALGYDGALWVTALAGGNTQLISIDLATNTATLAGSLGSDLGVVDMTADDINSLYVSTGSNNTVLRIDPVAVTSSPFLAGLSTPIGITFDAGQDMIWVANNPPGAPSSMIRADLTGTITPYATAGTDVDPYVHGVAIDIGGVVLTTQRAYDRVVAVQNFDAVQDFFTDMIVAPSDIEVLDMKP